VLAGRVDGGWRDGLVWIEVCESGLFCDVVVEERVWKEENCSWSCIALFLSPMERERERLHKHKLQKKTVDTALKP
jgi:hypothetical protein